MAACVDKHYNPMDFTIALVSDLVVTRIHNEHFSVGNKTSTNTLAAYDAIDDVVVAVD